MVFIYLSKEHIILKMVQIGAVGGEIWRIGSEKWVPRRGQFDIFANTGSIKLRCYQQPRARGSGLPLGTELDCCQSRPPYSIHI